MENLGKRIAQIRKSKGISQEHLAESAGINLRTVQRIESGETEPHGNTLRMICMVLEVQIEEIYDLAKNENYNYIGAIHFSVLSLLLFPLGNIILPLVLWLAKKGTIINLTYYSKKLLNFQLTWTIFTYFPIAITIIQLWFHLDLNINVKSIGQVGFIIFIPIMYSINLIYTITAGIFSMKGGKRNLYPIAIPFMRT